MRRRTADRVVATFLCLAGLVVGVEPRGSQRLTSQVCLSQTAGRRRFGSRGRAMVAIHGQRHNDVLRILQGELFVHEVIEFPLP
jgi:hypothetical protein